LLKGNTKISISLFSIGSGNEDRDKRWYVNCGFGGESETPSYEKVCGFVISSCYCSIGK
jgi:hypothetical protein